MARLTIILSLLYSCSMVVAQNVGINDNGQTPHASAMLHVESNSKGIIIPRMTSAQRLSISNPATGLLVYDNSTSGFWYYANNAWKQLLGDNHLQNLYMDGDTIKISEGNSSVSLNSINYWQKNGDDVHRTNGNVGIRVMNPLSALHIDNVLQVTGEFGSGDSLLSPGNVPRMFFYPRKGAMRAGGVLADQWDEPNLGDYSTAMGFSTLAQGSCGVSLGYYNEAAGNYSVALGRTSHATKDNSVAIGHSTWAYSPYETALGSWNTFYTPASATTWNPEDRLLVIGNGIDYINRSDALTILKNGNVGIGTSTPSTDLEIVGSASNTDAILWDNGQIALRHSTDVLRTNRQWLNFLVDADNSQNNAHFAIYNDSTTSNGTAVIQFNLDDGNSWINSGNVGIGTTTPTSLLQVAGNTKIDGDAQIDGDLIIDETTLFVDADNHRVGIGIITPQTKFHVAGGMKVDGSTFNIDAINNWVGIGTASPTADLEISGSSGTQALVWDNGNASLVHGQDLIRTKRDYLNILLDTDNDGDNAALRLFKDMEASSGTALINFNVDGNSWINSGNVGIGTTNPSANLEIVGDPESAAIKLDNGNVEFRHGEDFVVTNNSGLNFIVDANNNNSSDEIRFYNNVDNSLPNNLVHKLSLEDNSKTYFYDHWASGGMVGINTDNPEEALHVVGNFKLEYLTNWFIFDPEQSSLDLISENYGLIGEFNHSSGVYTALSDARLKHKISPLTGALSKIEALHPKTYQFISDEDEAPFSIGFLAQEVENVLPSAVKYNEKYDRYTLDYTTFGVLAVQAIKEQQETITNLEERIAALERIVSELTK